MADQDSDAVAISGGGIDGVTITGGTISGLDDAIAIADGGTGQTTKQDAFDALSPLTTEGDLITYDGVNNVRLGLGNAGEVLKTNATEDGLEWGVGYVSPTTTQGDLIVRGAADDERLGIGTAGQVLKVNGTGDGLEWANDAGTALTTQGDLLTRDGAGEVRLPIGTAGQVLQVNAGGTDPEWATLGTMSAQDADNVAITGGTISGLTTPLAVASGGTGLNALGTAGQGLLTVRGNSTEWSALDCLNINKTPQIANASLNDYSNPGSFEITGTNVTDRPVTATANATANLVVRRILTHVFQEYNDIYGNKRFYRNSQDGGTTWGDWIGQGNVAHYVDVGVTGQTITTGAVTKILYNEVTSISNAADFDISTSEYTIPVSGWWLFTFSYYLQGQYIANPTGYPHLFELRPGGITSHYFREGGYFYYYVGTKSWLLKLTKGTKAYGQYSINGCLPQTLGSYNRMSGVFLGV